MRVTVFFLLGILLLVVQTTILPEMPAWLGRPDLVFLLVLFLALQADPVRGALLTLLFGLLMDIFSGIILGLYPLTYLLIFFLLRGVARNLALSEPIHQVPLVAISILLANSMIYILIQMFAPETDLTWSWGRLFLQVLVGSVLCVPCFHLFRWLLHSLDGRNRPRPFPFLRRRSGNRFKVS